MKSPHTKINSDKLQKIKKEIEDKQKEENINLTFKPKINIYSRKLVEKKNNKEKVEDKLLELGNKYNKKVLLLQNQQKDKFTYRPTINKISNNMGKLKRIKRENILLHEIPIINPKYLNDSKSQLCKTEIKSNEKNISNSKDKDKNSLNNISNNSINSSKNKSINNIENKKNELQLTPNKNLYDYLYYEYKLLKQKRNKEINKNMILNYPFKPEINKSYNTHIKNNTNNVFKRLYTPNNKKNDIKLYRRYNQNINNQIYNLLTNKCNYEPTYKKKTNYVYKKNLSEDINNKYLNSLDENIKLNIINKYNFNKSNKKNYLQKSNDIILKAKCLKYNELFNNLDSDRDGFISYKNIKLSDLNFQDLIYLTPILKELQYKGIKMDLNTFVEKIQKIP